MASKAICMRSERWKYEKGWKLHSNIGQWKYSRPEKRTCRELGKGRRIPDSEQKRNHLSELRYRHSIYTLHIRRNFSKLEQEHKFGMAAHQNDTIDVVLMKPSHIKEKNRIVGNEESWCTRVRTYEDITKN